jgi:hypothetical protein
MSDDESQSTCAGFTVIMIMPLVPPDSELLFAGPVARAPWTSPIKWLAPGTAHRDSDRDQHSDTRMTQTIPGAWAPTQ